MNINGCGTNDRRTSLGLTPEQQELTEKQQM
jgi:hypothetical protein